MSGWYGSRRGGRGGCGSGSGSVRGRGRYIPRTIHINMTLEDYFFYVVSINQALDYEITDESVVNHINKTFYRGNNVS